MRILVTGSAGFVAGYLVEELLAAGHTVVGIDNFSKYGLIKKGYDKHSRYYFTRGDAKDPVLMKKLVRNSDQIVALAAMVGGISFLNKFKHDILAENEKLTVTAFESARWAFHHSKLKKINIISSSWVYGDTGGKAAKEGDERNAIMAHPYGLQKYMSECFARSAHEQYGLPFTIIRLFNAVGAGEGSPKALRKISTNELKMTMSHVIPDLALKVRLAPGPLEILGSGRQLRNYIHGKDLAVGIRLCIENKNAINQDFNLTSGEPTSVLDVAEIIWRKTCPDKKFEYKTIPNSSYDLAANLGNGGKAKKLLGFKPKISLETTVQEVVNWVGELRAA